MDKIKNFNQLKDLSNLKDDFSYQDYQKKIQQESSQDQKQDDRDKNLPLPIENLTNNKSQIHNVIAYSNMLYCSIQRQTNEDLSDLNSSLLFQNILTQIRKQNKIILQNDQQFQAITDSFSKCQNMTTQFRILSIKGTKYCEVVEVQIQFSWYKTQVQILNCIEPSPIHSCAQLDSCGSFGTVYSIDFEHESYAIKCISFDSAQSDLKQSDALEIKQKTVISALKEYFFLLLFSTLQIGPKVKKIMGFDLIITRQCIEFSMQRCEKRLITEQGQKQLKQALKLMHAHQIVHRDIKPDNIMYSKSFEKYVFIDFGGCAVIQQSVGQKTKSTFIGTTNYCSPEMLSLLTKKTTYVDLYYNDLFGLLASLEQIRQGLNSKCQKTFEYLIPRHNDLNSTFLRMYLTSLKYLFFNRKYQDLNFVWKKILKNYYDQVEQIAFKLMYFFMELQSNQYTIWFYWKYLDQFVNEVQQFENLRKIFKKQENIVLSRWQEYPMKKSLFNFESCLYKTFYINYGTNIKIQQDIMSILTDNASIETYIFNNYQKQNYGQDFIVNYFLIVLNYTTFIQNKYNAGIQMRVQACQKAIELIQNSHMEGFTKMGPLFKPNQKDFQPLIVFFQYFIFQIFEKVPQIFKDQSMIHSLSSLLLLGYPNHLLSANSLLRYQFFKQSTSRIKRILRFWKFILVSINFQKILYEKDQDNFIYQFDEKLLDEINKCEKQIMWAQNQSQESFFQLNQLCYVNLCKTEHMTEERYIQMRCRFCKPLNDISQPDYQQWIKIIDQIIKCNIKGRKYHLKLNQQQNFTRNIVAQIQFSIFSYVLSISQQHVWIALGRMKDLLKIIDKRIHFSNISLRYLIYERIKISFYQKDYQNIKQLTKLIVINNRKKSFQNLILLKTVTDFMIQLIFYGHEDISNRQQIILFIKNSGFDEVINQVLDFGLRSCSVFYLQGQHHFYAQFNNSKIFNNYYQTRVGLFRMMITDLRTLFYNCLFFNQYYKSEVEIKKFVPKSELDQQYYQKLNLADQCLQLIVSYSKLKEYSLKNNLYKKNELLYEIMNYHLERQQFGKAIQEFQNQNGQVTISEFLSNKENYLYFGCYLNYAIIKVKLSSYDPKWCSNIIQIYQRFKDPSNSPQDLLSNFFLYDQLFSAFIYTNKSFEEVHQLLLNLTKRLKNISLKSKFQLFSILFNQQPQCKCNKCFPRQLPNWDNSAFIEYLSDHIGQYYPRQNCYMAVILSNCLQSISISNKTKRKLVNFMMNSNEFLHHSLKDQLLCKINFYWLDYFNVENGIVSFYLQHNKFDISRTNKLLNEMRNKFDKKILKKHLSLHKKYFMSKTITDPLQLFLYQIVDYQEKLLNRDMFPDFVKKQFINKATKLYSVKFSDSSF